MALQSSLDRIFKKIEHRFAVVKRFGKHTSSILSHACTTVFIRCFARPVGRLCAVCANSLSLLESILAIIVLAGVSQACTGSMLPLKSPSVAAMETIDTRGGELTNGKEFDVYVFDDDPLGRLDTWQKLSIENNSFTIAYTSGNKRLAAVRGTSWEHDATMCRSLSEIFTRKVDLRNESPSDPLISGSCRLGDNSLLLTPLLCRITIRSIRCNFSGKPYEDESLHSPKVYLTYASSLCEAMRETDFTTRETVNNGRLDHYDMNGFTHPEMLFHSFACDIGNTMLKPGIELYCYPNTNTERSMGSPFTCLVIEGELCGHKRYWPIEINRGLFAPVQGKAGLERGVNYVFDISLRSSGVPDPDDSLSPADISLSCSTIAWEEKNETVEKY